MNKRTPLSGAVIAALGCLLAAPALAAGETVAASKTKVVAGQAFTFTKYLDEDGGVRDEIRDAGGRPVDESTLPKVASALLDARVSSWVEQTERAGRHNETLTVDVALDLPVPAQQEPIEIGEAHLSAGRIAQGAINGRSMTHEEMDAYADSAARQLRTGDAAQADARAQALSAWALRHGFVGVHGLEDALARGGSSATLALTAAQIRMLAASGDPAISGIEPHSAAKDDVDQAMSATNITSWALPYTAMRGGGVGIYMTEGGCPNPSQFSGNYVRLSGAANYHANNVGGILRAVSPDAFLYCRSGDALPYQSDLGGVSGGPPIHIVTRSSSVGVPSTVYDALDRDWDDFAYYYRLAVFNSGGNTGGYVLSPGKGLNVTTVGNYNDADNSIYFKSPFVDPATGNAKPEVVAPGVEISAGGETLTGTSQSTPHAAAFTADLMSASTVLQYRPHLAKARLLAGATDAISGGYDKVGLGGIDFLSAGHDGYWSWWQGENDWWGTFDAEDGSTDGFVSRTIYIPSSWQHVRVAISWMTRGTYTYFHRNDPIPIGLDLDLRVHGPNGIAIGGSYSYDNSFESFTFTPTVAGYYTFKINRYANRDTQSKLRIGMYVNYYN